MLEYIDRNNSPQFVGVFFGVFTFIAFVTLLREQAIWWIAAGSALLFYVCSFYFLFSIEHYSQFLRVVGYGGGTHVNVEYKESGSSTKTDDYFLLIRTSSSLICLNKNKATVAEIPIDIVKKIQYQIGDNNREFVDIQNIANKAN